MGLLTITAVRLVEVMLGMQGKDGRLDPSIETLAKRTGVDPSTVVRALDRLREAGFVAWARRLVRTGSRVEQTSNAYVLTVPGTPDLHFAQAARFRINLKASGPTEPAGPRWVGDKEARENAMRQLELLGYQAEAAGMRD